MKTIVQTPARRLTNAVWLRGQIQELIKSCDDIIEEDLKRSEAAWAGEHQSYRVCVNTHRHWKRQLERVLQGKTSTEALQSVLAEEGLSP